MFRDDAEKCGDTPDLRRGTPFRSRGVFSSLSLYGVFYTLRFLNRLFAAQIGRD